ncbi:MAG: nucleoside-diphosphate kinase [Candidatus Gracilibacteria bacterium]|nr:nucleoside-diphosphate kinase [Candidatus Gracilibacteria bacterium]MDD2908936.1 nucleoside-diphosphate kinase [Candidatus Gracilibacteria bacterium]
MIQKTLILLKPDAVQKNLIGQIIGRFETKGLKVIGLKMMNLDDKLINEHYGFLADKPFFPKIVSYMTAGPVVALAIEGEDSVATIRQLVGATNPIEATPGSIRADYAKNIDNNIIHASDSPETAEIELNRFFNVSTELFDYTRTLAN